MQELLSRINNSDKWKHFQEQGAAFSQSSIVSLGGAKRAELPHGEV
jgi:hypothetical protein